MTAKSDQANSIVNTYVLYSMGVGVVPLPVVDLAALITLQVYMLKKLSSVYGVQLSDEWGRATIGAIVGGTAPVALFTRLASLLKFIPVVGQVGALFSLSIAAGASTYALGKVFSRHFESGGTLDSFDPVKKRLEYDQHRAEFKQQSATQPTTIAVDAAAAAAPQTAAEKATGDQVESEHTVTEQAATEQAATEQAATEQAATEQAATDQAATDQAVPAQAATEQASTEQASTEQASTEQASTEQASTEQASTEQAPSGQIEAVQTIDEQGATEQVTSDPIVVEQPAIERPAPQQTTALAVGAEPVPETEQVPAGLEATEGDQEVTPTDAAVPTEEDKPNLRGVLTFDGANDFLRVEQQNVLCTSRSVTVEMWIKPDRFDNSPRLYSKAYGGEIETALGSDGRLCFYDGTAGGHGAPHQTFTSNRSLSADLWYHVALVRDLESEEQKLTWYINGEKDNEAITQYPVPKPSGNNVYFGARVNTHSRDYKGQLAEIRVWTRPRSGDEIRADMNRLLNGDEEGLLGYWCCDEVQGEFVRDKTENGYDMKLYGSPVWGQADVRTSETKPVMQFDGADDFIALPEMEIDYSQGVTIEAWVQHDSFPSWCRIVDFGNGQSSDNLVLAQARNSGNLAFHTYPGGKYAGTEAPACEIGRWSHVAAVVDSSGKTSLYHDGQLIKLEQLPAAQSVKRTVNYIGRSNWSADGYFHGRMAELRLWNRARTADEIRADKDKRLTGTEPGLVSCWPLNSANQVGVTPDLTGKYHGILRGAAVADSVSVPFYARKHAPFADPVLEFAGTAESYVMVKPFKRFPSTEITVECWLKSDHKAEVGTLLSYAKATRLDFTLYDIRKLAPHVKSEKLNSAIAYNDGCWHHVAVSWRSSDGGVKVYKDGTLVYVGSLARGQYFEDGGALVLGQDQDSIGGGFSNSEAFQGLLCDLRIWNRVRKADEIYADMRRRLTGQEQGLVGYWPLSEIDADANTPDLSPNKNHGAVHGAALTPAPDELDKANEQDAAESTDQSGLTLAQKSTIAPIHEYHATDPWRYQYSTNPNIGGGWIKDGVAFYAFSSEVQDTVPIYQYHATGPWRYQYSINPNIGGGWIKDGVAFHAYASQAPETVPAYEYHATDPWRYQYSTNPNLGAGWIKDGVAFCVFERIPPGRN